MSLTPDEIPPCCPALQSCCSCVSAFSLSLLNLKEDFPFWFFFIFLKKKIKRRRFWCPITGINVSLLEMLHQFKKKMWTLPGSYLEIKIKLNLLLISINRLIPNHMTSESGGKGQDYLKYWKPLAFSVWKSRTCDSDHTLNNWSFCSCGRKGLQVKEVTHGHTVYFYVFKWGFGCWFIEQHLLWHWFTL